MLKQPYLCKHLIQEYRTKTKLYVKASCIIVYGKENEENDLIFWCNMPIILYSIINFVHNTVHE